MHTVKWHVETYVNATWECENDERLAYATSIDARGLLCEPLCRRSLESLQALLNDMFTNGKALAHVSQDFHGPCFDMTYTGVFRKI